MITSFETYGAQFFLEFFLIDAALGEVCRGLTRTHKLTWTHRDSMGLTGARKDSQGLTGTRRDSQGLTGTHKASRRPLSVTLSVTPLGNPSR